MQDKAAVRAWRERWALVNAHARREATELTTNERMVALSQLFAFATPAPTAAADTTLWDRLQRLRDRGRRIHR